MRRAETTPPMLIEMKIEPAFQQDKARFDAALRAMADGEAAVVFETDSESGETIIKGPDETTLDRVITSMRDHFGVELSVGAPQVCFRETISRRASIDYTHKKHLPRSEFARVAFALAPLARGAGVRMSLEQEATPAGFLAAAQRGMSEALRVGILAGFPVVDLSVDLTDCAWHEQDSSLYAFEIAGRNAVREALVQSGSILLEPIMVVSIRFPRDREAIITADLKRRRAIDIERDDRGDEVVVSALVPLINMFGYASSLRSMTSGAGSDDLRFHAYAAAPDVFDNDPFRPTMAMRA